jgi:hypothetical protein
MRKRTPKGIRAVGQTKNLRNVARFLCRHTASVLHISSQQSRHAMWASTIAQKLLAKVSRHGIARPSLVDLAKRLILISKCFNRESHHHGFAVRNVLRNSESHHHHGYVVRSVIRSTVIRQLFSVKTGPRQDGSECRQKRRRANLEVFLSDSGSFTTSLPLTLRLLRNTVVGEAASSDRQSSIGPLLASHRATGAFQLGERIDRAALETNAMETLATRIVRQHRRQEQVRMGMNRELSSGLANVAPSRLPLRMEHPITYSSGSKKRSEAFGDSVVRREEAAPAVSVTQVADEVMKQLDRRLIAARERMGRA